MKMHARLALVVMALLGSSPGNASQSGNRIVCQDPASPDPYYGLAADQYLSQPQPNLVVKGTYLSRMRVGQVLLVEAPALSPEPRIMGTSLVIDTRSGSGGCEAFRVAFTAQPGQYNQVLITDGRGHVKTVDIELHR